MLKIQSQLARALRYQSAVGAERVVGHFDDSAKDFAGPPSGADYREALSVRIADAHDYASTRKFKGRIDPASHSIVGSFDDAA